MLSAKHVAGNLGQPPDVPNPATKPAPIDQILEASVTVPLQLPSHVPPSAGLMCI